MATAKKTAKPAAKKAAKSAAKPAEMLFEGYERREAKILGVP